MTPRASIVLPLTAVIAALPAEVMAAPSTPRFSIPASRLSSALTVLARQAGIDVLFADTLVGDRVAPALRGKMTVDAALVSLLDGSGLTFRRTSDGAIVIAAMPAAAPPPKADEAIPEILVIGRRAQNGDIRRTQGDIQPYQVFTNREIEDSHAGSIDSFSRTRLPANAQIISPAQNLRRGQGSTRSEINLRGLGANQTLLLVDGRRMPDVPAIDLINQQPDVNGIPINLIDRIEVLTASAGGIYGIGATSGALNVVLRHDYEGGEVAMTTGITTRGDAFEERLFGRFGISANGGRSGLMVAVGQSRADALRFGDRNYFRRARERALANSPAEFLGEFPIGNSVNIFSRTPLVFNADRGGAALGSTRTTLPLGLDDDPARRDALLLANAGMTQLDPGGGGAKATITSQPETRAIFLDARHDFGGGFIAFGNFLDTRNTGRTVAGVQSNPFTSSLSASDPRNPFQQEIFVTEPSDFTVNSVNRIEVRRYTLGLIAPLPGGWRANIEYSGGGAKSRFEQNAGTETLLGPRRNRFDDGTLRVAGPVATLPGGPLTLSFLGEARRIVTEASELAQTFDTFSFSSDYPRLEQRVLSLYGEARAPLLGARGFLSELEFQLAVRQDWTRTILPGSKTLFGTELPPFITFSGTPAYTVGTRFSPLPGLLVRASIGTGSLPPTANQIGRFTAVGEDYRGDPRRGGRTIGSEGAVTFLDGGNPDLLPERARSFLFGVVVTPAGDHGPRLSIDYTRINKRNEIQSFPFFDVDTLIAEEAKYPRRVIRGPLTAADRALGFTGGPIQTLDFSLLNLGRTRIDAVDVTLDYPFELPRLGGFTAYLKATWEPHYRQQLVDGSPFIERVGSSDGPLELRGNAGVDWSSGPWSAGINAQFYSSYMITNAYVETINNPLLLSFNGMERIPAQVYVDLSGRYRVRDGSAIVPRGTEVRVGIINLFDHRPPTIADLYSSGASYYGDPRQRRVEATLAVPFGK
ncbi:TonB-dependent receptor [Glacieibacterium frigidum]|uniref:TonB-dependent receptor n=1 Tax=Glacieibacterium frigidum TaxID=2593303 RepID=A0A552U862_9SPHN|nr:TonB-dependent receptor [Glacieibacterium frigidum]TRW14407.1 TonB-dependent receptor [Glacieibacterium frigidum]